MKSRLAGLASARIAADPRAPARTRTSGVVSRATHAQSAAMDEARHMPAKKPVPNWVYFIPFMIAGLVVLALGYDLVTMGS